jgi:lipopolysaccharide assembly outer membrane protein LptD (OstA)
MLQPKSKFSLNYLFFLILCSGGLPILTLSKNLTSPAYPSHRNINLADTIKPEKVIDTSLPISNTDSTKPLLKVDSVRVKVSKDSLNAPLEHAAEDSMVLEVDTRKIFLYGKTEVKYEDVVLNAPKIEFDQQSQYVTAKMGKDTAGVVMGMAKLKQAETVTVSDSLNFNLRSQRGLTYSSFFQQEDFFNYAQKVKKISPEIFYASKGRFTTCNLDTPHFAFSFKKAKFINKKLVVTGPVHPEFEDVPVPIYLPFGIFPMQKGRQSGIIPPQFTVTEDFGVGLEGLGYYRAVNDYLDAKIWFDLYSYGTWRANFSPTYRKRYRYNGRFNISIQNTKFAFKGDPDYRKNKSFFVTWSHSMDSKALPGVSFSANVNAGSSKYLSLVPNASLVNPGFSGNAQGGGNYMQPMNFTNQLSSSISYQKNWHGTPFNLSVNLNHNQNTARKTVNLNLPDIAFMMNTIYPFQPKESVGPSKWYEKLGVGYSGNYKGQVSFYDTAFRFKQLIDTFQWGASHDIPITLSLPSLGPFQIAPSISFKERWFAQKLNRTWNTQTNKLDTSIERGFNTAREMTMGISFNTAIFGKFESKNKEAKIQAIRHVMRPQFGINYRPDMMKPYYYRERVNVRGDKVLMSVFDGAIFSPFSSGENGGMSFGIDNNIEMKARSKKDTGDAELKKVKLIDGFGINGSYNFLADSFKLSTFNLYARSNLFEKINITANANLDPYQKNPENGFRINKYAWEGKRFTPGTIVNGNINISTNIQSKRKDDKGEKEKEKVENDDFDNVSNDQMQQQLDYIRRNPAEFTDFNIPWTLNFSYSLSFSKLLQRDYTYKTEITSSINFNGDFSLTKKWKIGANGYYDIKTMKLQSLTTYITRDLHCWQMSINVTPIGLYRFFNITISPKSGILRDLKINRTRYFYSQ